MSCQQLILLTALVADNWYEASLTRNTRPNTNDKTIYSFLLYHHSDFTLMSRDCRWGCISCQAKTTEENKLLTNDLKFSTFYHLFGVNVTSELFNYTVVYCL